MLISSHSTCRNRKDWPKLNRWPHLSYIHSAWWALKFISLTNSLKCLVSLHFLPFYYVCLHEGFLSFPYLNSFHWQETLQTPQWFLCAKWTSVKRVVWNLSTPGDQTDLAAAQDETNHSSKCGHTKTSSFYTFMVAEKGANYFILQPEFRMVECFHYLWTSMALGHN